MVTERAAFFSISDNDHQVFNYTGDQPKSEGDKSPLIYDSNAQQFKMKWWSTYPNHLHFPNNDWCIEQVFQQLCRFRAKELDDDKWP